MKTWQNAWAWVKRRKKRLFRKPKPAVVITLWVRMLLTALAVTVVYEAVPGDDARFSLAIMAAGVMFMLFSWWLLLPAVVVLTCLWLNVMFTRAGQHDLLDILFRDPFLRVACSGMVIGMMIGIPPFLAILFHDRKPFWKRWRGGGSEKTPR